MCITTTPAVIARSPPWVDDAAISVVDELYERYVPIFYLRNLIFYHCNQAAEQPIITSKTALSIIVLR